MCSTCLLQAASYGELLWVNRIVHRPSRVHRDHDSGRAESQEIVLRATLLFSHFARVGLVRDYPLIPTDAVVKCQRGNLVQILSTPLG